MSEGITDQPEGTTPIDDVSGLLQDITTRGELNDAEGLNIVNAIDWVDKGRINDLFTIEFYRTLHTKMYDEVWAWVTWATDTLVVDSAERKTYITALKAADTGDFQPLMDYLGNLNPDR